ncbi:putative leucine-rich repeat domain superfamily [Helianthus annuus]|uniref:Leucine-rich repeat domain superfamily n=1 Tax=Helianthus annuus TaxID=4232 RepID=A0A251U7X7_HELAN|nr:F-box/LRR-repeat protein 12 isoform X1 [Helianthus annuus]XP_021978064.1 F-box/LRR-repeat protein 12 isoform X1 [Helianthus annuus]KAF5796117.1 putative leucine-rich repeat domain superfamily [Helianthus annuus]KAF5796118.1 putative leucine-rich repeat domain superfamily [Helianthus annuus]KAJ0554224.1 putative leucine-rich repeat domain superfamily [Helianthus annuus]KAJ0898709.1 putative leucine-rich repeat domain superfamily [Helianthus annuus]KAJ0898710.1 putative leucine-rich repeat d
MGVVSRKQRSCITNLPDDYLYLIFEKLDSNLDRESFGLTCHRFLNIHDSSCKVLDLQHLSWLKNSSRGYIEVHSCMIHRLLNRFRQLESLSLTGCKDVTDSGLVLLQKYGLQLRSIDLDSCARITNVGFSSIASGCPSLSVINLSSSSIGDSGLEILTKSCNSLKKVSLGWCENITDSGIQSLIQNCRQLTELRITGCSKINGIGFKGCSSTLASLEANCCMLATDLTEVLSGGGLEYLNIAFNYHIMEYGLAAIGSGVAANLKTLNLSGCSFVTDYVIIRISKGCPFLQEWNLASCKNITISGWESIGLYCQSLERIHVNGCLKLCGRGLLALGNGCKQLSVIYINFCPLITPSVIQFFRMQREDVEIKDPPTSLLKFVPGGWTFETLSL